MSRLDKLASKLRKQVVEASGEFDLLEEGDHVLVCLSGGKDSHTMLSLLLDIQKRAPFAFELTAFHLDQKQPGYPEGVMEDYLASIEVPHRVIGQDTYSVVQEKLPEWATPCSLCSRMRRGIIYANARELGCNKVALGHHRDDSIETLLMNLFHSGRMQAMPAIFTNDEGDLDVIRPLIYLAEDEIAEYAELMDYPIIPCTLCGSTQTQRDFVKELLDDLEGEIPQIRGNIMAAIGNVKTSHLMDRGVEAVGEEIE